MKIKVILTSSYPLGNVTTDRAHLLCKGLVENGADLELVITQPTETYENEANHLPNGFYDTVHFRYIGGIVQRNKSKLIRKFIDIYTHVLVVLELLMNRSNFEYVLIIGPSIDFRLIIPFLSFLSKKFKTLLEINEYPFVSKKNNLLTRAKKCLLFRCIFPLYDGFIVISNSLNELIIKHKSKKATSIIVPILGENPTYMRKSRITPPIDYPYILHTGSMIDSKDGIMGILEALKIVRTEYNHPIKLVITGTIKQSRDVKQILNYISMNGLSEYVIFTGFLDKKGLESYLSNCSLTIINKYSNVQNMFCFPTKTIDYLKYEVPLIITSVGDISDYFTNGDNAFVIAPEDNNVLASTIVQILNHPSQANTMAKRAKLLLTKEFSYQEQGHRLINFFESLT